MSGGQRLLRKSGFEAREPFHYILATFSRWFYSDVMLLRVFNLWETNL